MTQQQKQNLSFGFINIDQLKRASIPKGINLAMIFVTRSITCKTLQ